MASTLNEVVDEEVDDLIETSLFNFPDDPVRNLVFEAHGRKAAMEACVVTAAIVSELNFGEGKDTRKKVVIVGLTRICVLCVHLYFSEVVFLWL